jgi:hypothetical protein
MPSQKYGDTAVTLIVGARLGDVVLLAGDSQHIWHKANEPEMIDDRACKVERTPIGLFAGAGSINVLRHLSQIISIQRPDSIGLAKAAKSFVEEFERLHARKDPRVATFLRSTGFFITRLEGRKSPFTFSAERTTSSGKTFRLADFNHFYLPMSPQERPPPSNSPCGTL